MSWFRVAWEGAEDELPSTCGSPCEILEFDGSCLYWLVNKEFPHLLLF